MNILTELWYGNIKPIKNFGANNKELKSLEFLIERHYEYLNENCSKNCKESLEKYTDCFYEYLSLIEVQAFHDGFCVCAKILTEALNNSSSLAY